MRRTCSACRLTGTPLKAHLTIPKLPRALTQRMKQNNEFSGWDGAPSRGNLKIGNSRVGLDFNRHDHRTFCNVVDITGDKLLVNVAFRN